MFQRHTRFKSTQTRMRLQPSKPFLHLPTESKLERWKSISFIVSSIAIPIVLAIVGYYIQKQLSEEGLKKDYVSIAASILKENPTNQEPELRKWAVTMLDSNSPISFSGKAKAGLEKGSIYLAIAPPRIPNAPEGCMEEPRPAKIAPMVSKLFKKQYDSTEEMAKDFKKFVILSLNAEKEAMFDRAALECLQKYSKLIAQWTEETAARYEKPIDQWPPVESK